MYKLRDNSFSCKNNYKKKNMISFTRSKMFLDCLIFDNSESSKKNWDRRKGRAMVRAIRERRVWHSDPTPILFYYLVSKG